MSLTTVPLSLNTIPKMISFDVDLQTGNVLIRYDVITDDGRPLRSGLSVTIAFSQLLAGEQAVVTGQIGPFCESKVNADWANRVATKT